jgi:hypothetical protein
MDKAVVRPGRPHEESLGDLERLWEIVSRVGGALVLDWHAHCLNPRALAGAGSVLVAFLERALERGARVCTPLELITATPSRR